MLNKTKNPAEPGKPRVLIVDDDVDCTDMLEELLQLSGYSALSAHEGASGLAAVANFDPHIVLLDVRMPGLDGEEFIRHLRANEGPSLHRSIIVCSGLPQYSVQSLKGDRYLPKPIEWPKLQAMLDEEWREKFADTPWCF